MILDFRVFVNYCMVSNYEDAKGGPLELRQWTIWDLKYMNSGFVQCFGKPFGFHVRGIINKYMGNLGV